MPNSQKIESVPAKNIERLFIENQDVIIKIVDTFIQRNTFPRHERQDIIQNIHEILLRRKNKIARQFKGNSSFRTYLYAIVRNISLRMAENFKKNLVFTDSYPDHGNYSLPENNIIIMQELERFDKCLQLVSGKRKKLEFLLKIKFRIPIEKDELNHFSCQQENVTYDKVFKSTEHYKQLSDNYLFKTLTDLLNKSTSKNITANSLIKWTKTKINQIIQLMNGEPKRADYSEETINILVEKYFQEKIINQTDQITMKLTKQIIIQE